jgi:hypothetical protein
MHKSLSTSNIHISLTAENQTHICMIFVTGNDLRNKILK